MTNRERVLMALNFEKPDYAPYEVWFTQQMLAKMIGYTGDPEYQESINSHICTVELNQAHEEIRPEFFRDEFGVVWNRTGADKDIGVVDRYLIEDTEDLVSLRLPEVDEKFIRGEMDRLMKNAGERFRLANIGFSLFERAWTLRGMENLLCDMMLEPEFVHELMNRITEYNLRKIDIALEYDIDGFLFGDDWGQQKGLIMGPKCWHEFIEPYLAKMYAKVRKAGKYVAQHSCGDIREIMDDLHNIGLNMYQTFQPEIYGFDYSKKLDGKITVWGGISTQRHLPVLSTDGVKQVTRELLDAFPHGGLVAAPTHSVPGDVPPENIEAMLLVLDNQN